jgi:putative heme-binding domain-containing protein
MTARAVIALVVCAWAVSATAQEVENPFTLRMDMRMGASLYQAQCASCHGLDAAGGEEGRGPALNTGRFRHASSDGGLFRVIRDGVNDTGMMGVGPDVPEQSVWQLVTYLRSLVTAQEAVELPGSAANGREVFLGRGDCTRCHKVEGRGGRLAPDLSRVAERRDPEELRSDLVDPHAEVSPRWWTLKITTADGSVVEGLRMSEDTFTLRLMDADEQLRSFSKSGVRSYDRIQDSTMPSYAQSLSPPDIADLVAYLYTLREEE